jgi:hypothetical protein
MQWVIVTQNIRRLSFYTLPSRPLPSQGVVIDGSVFLGAPPAEGGGAHYCISEPAEVPCTIPVRKQVVLFRAILSIRAKPECLPRQARDKRRKS